jgi:chromosome segregation protein
MYLKELRLHGFKSFADPTHLDLRPGVTAIVGPNGCGKSNIADAIRWVLGEQSAKSLRAGAMQDVIFQGAATRKPVNLCQVTLVFAECEELLGTDYSEVEVTRKVLREGGSTYLLNGKACRLKDIQRLFQDTGVGQVSYSFMLQGQIDQVLSSNANERRAIFEEAAGISRYKSQRREALNKLEQVDSNLSRVTDVMDEVARQTASLKRQAAKALRYKRIQRRLQRLELAQFGFRFAQTGTELEGLRVKGSTLKEEEARLRELLDSAESELSQDRHALGEVRTLLDAGQKSVYSLRETLATSVNQAELASYKVEELRKRIAEIEKELQELATTEIVLADKLKGESEAKEAQLSLFGDSDQVFQDKSKELTALQGELIAAEKELAGKKQQLAGQENAISRLRSNCTSLELELKTSQVRHANLTEELNGLGNRKGTLEQELEALGSAQAQRERQFKEQEAHLQSLKEQQATTTASFRSVQERIQNLDRERARLEARSSVLESLQQKLEGFSDGAKALLNGAAASGLPENALTLFLQKIQVTRGYTRAVEQLLGPALEGVFLASPELISPVLKTLKSSSAGRATLVTDLGKAPQVVPSGNFPKGIQAASAVVRTNDSDLELFLSYLLGDCLVCDDLATLIDYWQSEPSSSFRTAATKAGEWVDARGLISTVSSSKASSESSFLERREELQRIQTELADLEDRLERERLQAERLQGQLSTGESALQVATERLGELSTELSTMNAQRETALRGITEIDEQLATKKGALAALERATSDYQAQLAKAQIELESMDSAIKDSKVAIETVETRAGELRLQQETQRSAFEELRFAVVEKKQRLELLDRGLDDLRRQAESAAETRTRRLAEQAQLKGQIVDLGGILETHEHEQADLKAKEAALMEQLGKYRETAQGCEKRIAIAEESLSPTRAKLEDCLARQNQEEVARARLESRLQFIEEESRRDYDRDPREIDWALEFWKAGEALPERIRVDVEEAEAEILELEKEPDDPTDEQRSSLTGVDWSVVESEVDSLRGRIQSMGPVNIDAIEDYRELRERHEFLKQQSDDLWKAKTELLETIEEINATSQQLFSDTFASIRKNFHYTFGTLFGGGKADLELIDSEDVLESGIEITAQPPGTRLRNLALLSGGQKTMTAVALLFAIYMVKPSPFCVLDEIDAPLDDANIGRFTGMLEGFLEYSQFLIITHNKRTISVADTIYGATMQEKGVSRLISMRFNQKTGEEEPAAADAPVDPAAS